MIPAKLVLTNFMCYRGTSSPLLLEGMHIACICGDNGHGKSALLDAITWALWGKARAKSADDLVHTGQSDMEVDLEFTAADERYRVIRKHSIGKRGRSGHTLLELHVGTGQSDSTFRAITTNTVRETQRRITELLRMDYDTFVNSAFLRQGRADEFTLRTPKERKEVLAEILGLSLYDRLESEARNRARGLELKIAVLEQSISNIEVELERKPASEAELAEVKGRLSQVERDEALQRLQVEKLGRRKDLLELKKAELERILERIEQERRDMQQLHDEAELYRKRRQEYEHAMEQQEAVVEGYGRYLEATRRKEDLDKHLVKYNALRDLRGRLEKEVQAEKVRLVGRVESLRATVDMLEAKAANVETWEEELVECGVRLASLDELEAELKEHRGRLQGLLSRAHHLESTNRQLKQEMEGLRAKVDMLVGGAAQCPLCGSKLGEDGLEHIRNAYEREGQHKKEEYRENQHLIKELASNRDADERHIRDKESDLARKRRSVQGRASILERDVNEGKGAREKSTTLRAELEELDSRLSKGEFGIEAQRQLGEAVSELTSLGYDPESHRQVMERLAGLKQYDNLYRMVEEARLRIPEVQQALARTEARESRLRSQLEDDSRQQASIGRETAVLPQLKQELEAARSAHVQLEEEHRRWRDRMVALQEGLRRLGELEKRRKADMSALKGATRSKGIYEELGHAFGKGGAQALIIETVLPEIEEEANGLLSRMTDNRMHVKIESQREKKTGGSQETLDINIADELGTRPYELFSGGEAFRINFALRIALSKLLAHRAGAPLPTLFIDEGFGTQDGTGREKLLETINAIQSDFERIIVITHMEELREAFPVRIEVRKTEGSSTFSVN